MASCRRAAATRAAANNRYAADAIARLPNTMKPTAMAIAENPSNAISGNALAVFGRCLVVVRAD
jgi:hypothetical protein